MGEEESKKEPVSVPQQPKMTKDQMIQMAFQNRLNSIATLVNDLYRDCKDIMSQKE